MPSYQSPAFDINGSLVTIDLEGGDYSNLPSGYYTSPGMAAVARGVSQQTGGPPATAQEVYAIYSNTNAQNQQAVQQIFNNPPPPSNYQAPEPPTAVGWVAPVVTPPRTSEELIAQMYVDNGYTPPAPAVLTAIAAGQVVAPLTDPLPVAATPPDAAQIVLPASALVAGVDNFPASAQTAPQLPSTMPGIHPDTAAFVVGQHSSGNPIMELVDANDNLVQWVPGAGAQFIVAPFYVTAAPAVNEKRLIGGDDDGNPVFQLIDTAGTLVQWTENRGQTGYVTAPFSVSTGNLPGQTASGGNTAANSQNGGGNITTVTTDNWQPTRQVGQTTKGFPIYQLRDATGVVKQWIIDPSNPNVILDLVNAPTLGTVYHDSVTDAAVISAGGGNVAGAGGEPELGPLDRPQIQVGTTPRGFPIYQIQDSAGMKKQWIIDPGPPSAIVDLRNVPAYGVLVHTSATDQGAPAGGGATAMTTGTAKSSTTVLFIALGAGALWLWNSRKQL